MSQFGRSFDEALDKHITGNYGEDQFKEFPKDKKCVLCKKKYKGYGHNPTPLRKEGSCCDSCNYKKVIPERMRDLK